MMNTAGQFPDGADGVRMTDEQRSRYYELRSRGTTDLRRTGDLGEFQALRFLSAATHRFPAVASDDEPEAPANGDELVAVSYFPGAPGAPMVTAQPASREMTQVLRRRLFGTTRGERANAARHFTRLRKGCPSPTVTRPVPVRARSRQRRDGSRRHATRGGTTDDAGGSSPSDLPGPQHPERACAICGIDISHRRADAETCNATHKKALQRARSLAGTQELFEHTACVECGRRWLSDLNPRRRSCPCGGILQIGVPHQQVAAPQPVPPDPLAGVGIDIFDCVYNNAETTAMRPAASPRFGPLKLRSNIVTLACPDCGDRHHPLDRCRSNVVDFSKILTARLVRQIELTRAAVAA